MDDHGRAAEDLDIDIEQEIDDAQRQLAVPRALGQRNGAHNGDKQTDGKAENRAREGDQQRHTGALEKELAIAVQQEGHPAEE